MTADLQSIREQIEALDEQLLELLKRRMEIVDRVLESKLRDASPLRDPLREDHVLQRVRRLAAEADLDAHQVERLYRLILEMSIARQQEGIRSRVEAPLRVAFQGVEGAYSHLAAQQRYRERSGGVLLTGLESFREVAEAVRDGTCDLGLLPIENTTAGSINETYDLLAEGGLEIIGEQVSAIDHCLLALPGVELDEIETVLSHPQALAQCEAYFRRHPHLAPRAEFDTAGAARKVRDSGDRRLAAIASESAGRVFGLAVVDEGIQSQQGNFTRFVEVAREAATCPADAACKTSLLLVVSHQPGALGEVLTRFGERGVQLLKLESRPIPGVPFKYRFYLDVEGHAASREVVSGLEAVAPFVEELKLLGTYPKASPL